MSATAPARPKLLLADGTSIVRRVYEAVKGEHDDGRVQGALRSSWGSFMRALRTHEPTHFLAAFDHGGPTWRHRLYPQYKADRAPAPEVLTRAIPGFLEVMNNSGMRTLRVPDVEADDTLTTLATRAIARGFDVVLLSSDRDLYRLIDYGVRVYDHFQNEWRDEAWVRERFGVPSRLITDLLALMGDDTDGIPGVKHVGEKTAPRLLAEYGDCEGVIANAASITGKLGERLREGTDLIRLSKALATMRHDVELGITPRDIVLPRAILPSIYSMPEPALVRTSQSSEVAARRMSAQPASPSPAGTKASVPTRRPRF